MPLILNSSYKPPVLFGNGHLQSIFPTVVRRVPGVQYLRERIETPDEDFIDLDWSRVGSTQSVIVSHGLEGHSQRSYMRGMIRALNRRCWDAVAFNFRGCSGEPNRRLRSYHSGATEDLETVVTHVIRQAKYNALALVGFSIGGNLTLKYLGERGDQISPLIRCAAAISVPCDLAACARKLSDRSNFLYLKRFLKMFHRKIRLKMQIMPDRISDDNFQSIRSLKEFDDRYTAPIHGFLSAEDYWSKCSCKQFFSGIQVPALLISAQNDPFLTPECFPVKEAQQNPHLLLEMPASGGHVGFVDFNPAGEYWHERRVASFFQEVEGFRI